MRFLLSALLGLCVIGAAASSAKSAHITPTLDISRDAIVNAAATCDDNTVVRRTVYYDASNLRRRDCDGIWPDQLDTNTFTDIVLAFAVFDPDTFAVGLQHPDDAKAYEQLLAMPEKNHKGIAIGGSAMPKGGAAWSNMASTQSNRKAFIDSLKQFLGQWNFKSIEIHWEWPNGSDTQNQVLLMRELGEGLGKDFGITVVVPPQDVLLKNMDLKGMEDSVHWFTFLAFDLHGPWDGSTIRPHTDLAEIDAALNLLSSTNIAPRKINLGIANYGRGFTVAGKDCMYYGCESAGPSKAGSCTKEQGLLSACEIGRIIQEKNLTPQLIKGGAGAKEITWDDQWISYDDADTLALKLELANKHCLGGTSLWAIDYSQCDGNSGPPQLPGSSSASGPSPSTSSKKPSSAASSQTSATPSSAVSSGQPSSEAGSSDSTPTNTGSSVSGSSVLISSGFSSSAQSSAHGSSGVKSTSPASSVKGSASETQGSSATTTSGASTSPTQSSANGSSFTGSSAAGSSVLGSSRVASSTNDGSFAWLSTVSGSERSSDHSATRTGTASGSPSLGSSSSGFSGSATGSASSSGTWGSSVSTAPSSESQDSSQTGSSTQGGSLTGSDSSVANTSGGSSQGPSRTSQSGSSSVAPSQIVSSSEPSPTATGCPDECNGLPWCQVFCKGWKFPRPDDVQPPKECLLPENANWCRNWWWGAPSDDSDSDGDPDSHSDSDPNCQPNDCVKDCAAWNVVTFLATKRPFCPCVPKKCDKDGDSDSPSDSDDDEPKDKPKPTSIPKKKNPECKLLGCGCGWMGLGFGPGCPGMEIDLDIPCGLFGCDPCIFFGCPGIKPKGLIGWDGYCLGEGCDPCPPELCKLPDCTIPGGCGPKPGPAPTKPAELPDPEECDDSKRTVITERFVWCTEGFNVSALPSSMRETSSTMISSMCLPMIDATVTVCGGAMPGFDTTTTQTGKNTLSSDAPACTRAPLSLDDDEGNNNPDDPLNTSSTYASNTTTASLIKTSSSSKSSSKSTSTSSTTKTSFAPPYPSLGPMDRKGRWKVKLNQYMNRDYSEVKWQLFDPNSNHAGENKVSGNNMESLQDKIRTVNRPKEHSMPFDVKMKVLDPTKVDECYVFLDLYADIWGCDKDRCRPWLASENYIEDKPFQYRTCEDDCKDIKPPPLIAGDLWCQDLNDADWYPDGSGWRRDFECGWKGYRLANSGPI
ncbi:glycoside hydrolase family 18 protein [Stemphylium lycopersici]|nr:glycoside hydrolase family 18 protein [Stemphylium lycopersici]RAR09005.1 glycoside hydrolase family 18 protein [Stemphylium lycopersici]